MHARATASRSSPSTRTGRSARSTCSASRFSTELGYTNLLTALDLAGIPLLAADRSDEHPMVIAGGHAAFNPEPIADFIDARRARRRRGSGAARHRHRPRLEERRPARRPRRAADAARDRRRRLRAALLRRRLPAGRPDPAGRAQPQRRAVARRQAHGDGPRRVAVPEETAGAAGRDGARALQRRDLPRLHPRLPVLPGRHDHPAGARALDHRRSARWCRRASRPPASRRSACCRCPAPTTARSARSPRASPTATRAPTSRCRCRRPGSTRSTSPWPTSCPATAVVPA